MNCDVIDNLNDEERLEVPRKIDLHKKLRIFQAKNPKMISLLFEYSII